MFLLYGQALQSVLRQTENRINGKEEPEKGTSFLLSDKFAVKMKERSLFLYSVQKKEKKQKKERGYFGQNVRLCVPYAHFCTYFCAH